MRARSLLRWRSGRVGVRSDPALGEALRARASRRSDHGVRPQPGLLGVSRPRVRVARRRARRQRQRRRRLRLQLTMPTARFARGAARAGTALALAAARRRSAGVLPEDRADVLYHRYQGGGVTIEGPSVLVRKKIGENFAVAANYYMDMVSSASIDVKLSASQYKEERKQKSLCFDYLRGKSTYSAGVIDSKETDYAADTAFFALSQDMFGDLTTVIAELQARLERRLPQREARGRRARCATRRSRTRLGHPRLLRSASRQILTRNLILALNYEVHHGRGLPQQPVPLGALRRSARPRGFSLESEIYPRTHTSNAASARLQVLPALSRGARRQLPLLHGHLGRECAHGRRRATRIRPGSAGSSTARLRYYRQTAADFYCDLFPRRQFAELPRARQGALHLQRYHRSACGASYEFTIPRVRWIQKSTVNARSDHMIINYDDFRDATATDPGNGIVAGQRAPLQAQRQRPAAVRVHLVLELSLRVLRRAGSARSCQWTATT